jgi:hypothetical protein
VAHLSTATDPMPAHSGSRSLPVPTSSNHLDEVSSSNSVWPPPAAARLTSGDYLAAPTTQVATMYVACRSRLVRARNGGVGYWNPLNAPAWGADPSHKQPVPLVAVLLTFPLDASPSDEWIMHQAGSSPDLPRSHGWHQDVRNAVPSIL